MEKKKKTFVIITVVIVVLVLAGIALWIFRGFFTPIIYIDSGERHDSDAVSDPMNDAYPAESIEIIYLDDGGEGDNGYECPSAVTDAIEKNPDVYAWLVITDTDITYPICNRPGDNKFYLNHSSDAKWNPMGALYTEDYNSRDFTDNVTVVYGHSMTGTRYFGTLQKNYSDRKFFDEHREIKVYLEDKVLTYNIFAAVPYSNAHILYYYDFTVKPQYTSFFEGIGKIRNLNAIIDKDNIPEFDEKVLILSTCLKGYNNKRFLLLATLNDPENE